MPPEYVRCELFEVKWPVLVRALDELGYDVVARDPADYWPTLGAQGPVTEAALDLAEARALADIGARTVTSSCGSCGTAYPVNRYGDAVTPAGVGTCPCGGLVPRREVLDA